MSRISKTALVWLLAAIVSPLAGCSSAARYPNRTVVLVVPWGAGGGTDLLARFLAHELERELGKPTVVVNKIGGGGASGHSAGAWALPDGYTITMGTFELSTMRAMGLSPLTYRDFQPLAQVNADAAAIIVRSDAPWHSLRELLDDVRARPGQIKMSGTAAGGAWDLARAGLMLADGQSPDAIRWVPSQGAGPSLVDLLGGHIDTMCCSVPEVATQLADRKVRVLGVMSAERLEVFPNLTTAKEEGIDWEAVGWRGLLLPPDTPAAVSELLTAKLEKILASAEYHEFMNKRGYSIVVRGPAEFQDFLAAQEVRWQKVIDEAGFASSSSPHDPGPWLFPSLLTALLVAGTAGVIGKTLVLSQSATPAPAIRAHPQRYGDLLVLVAALPAYVAAIGLAGFFPSTLVFATLLVQRLGMRWYAAAGLCGLLLAVIYVLFVQVFRVQLPAGVWGRF